MDRRNDTRVRWIVEALTVFCSKFIKVNAAFVLEAAVALRI